METWVMRPRIWSQAFGFWEVGWLQGRRRRGGRKRRWHTRAWQKRKRWRALSRFFLERVCVVDVTGTRKTPSSWSIQRVSARKILRVLALLPTAKNAQQSKQARLKAYTAHTHARTHAGWTTTLLTVCLFVGWLQRKSELLYVTSFLLCRSSSLTFSATPPSRRQLPRHRPLRRRRRRRRRRPGSGGVSGWENDKNHHSGKINSCRDLLHKPKPYTQTHRGKENCNNEKKHGTQQLTRVGPSRKPSQRTTLHTKQQQQSYYNRNQASKQASA